MQTWREERRRTKTSSQRSTTNTNEHGLNCWTRWWVGVHAKRAVGGGNQRTGHDGTSQAHHRVEARPCREAEPQAEARVDGPCRRRWSTEPTRKSRAGERWARKSYAGTHRKRRRPARRQKRGRGGYHDSRWSLLKPAPQLRGGARGCEQPRWRCGCRTQVQSHVATFDLQLCKSRGVRM